MKYWKQVYAIIKKDVITERRAKEAISAMLVFGFIVIVMFNFAFNLSSQEQITIAPGLLWIAFMFAGILGLNHSFTAEHENNCLQGMMLTPVPRSVIYIGKLAGSVLFMFLAELAMLGFFVWLYDVRFTGRWHLLLLTMLLGTLGYCIVGTLFSAISAGTRVRSFMLPILQLPIVVPVIIASVESTSVLLQEDAIIGYFDWLKILLSFNVIFFTVCVLLFEYVLEE